MNSAFQTGHGDDASNLTRDDISADALDAMFDVLSADRRRHTLQYLVETDATVPLSKLATAVATAETGESSASTDAQQQVAIDLHHRHLPKLADEGLISYDVDANLTTVTETGRKFDTVRTSLLENTL